MDTIYLAYKSKRTVTIIWSAVNGRLRTTGAFKCFALAQRFNGSAQAKANGDMRTCRAPANCCACLLQFKHLRLVVTSSSTLYIWSLKLCCPFNRLYVYIDTLTNVFHLNRTLNNQSLGTWRKKHVLFGFSFVSFVKHFHLCVVWSVFKPGMRV